MKIKPIIVWRRYIQQKQVQSQLLETQTKLEDLENISKRKVDEDIAVMNMKAESREKQRKMEGKQVWKEESQKQSGGS